MDTSIRNNSRLNAVLVLTVKKSPALTVAFAAIGVWITAIFLNFSKDWILLLDSTRPIN